MNLRTTLTSGSSSDTPGLHVLTGVGVGGGGGGGSHGGGGATSMDSTGPLLKDKLSTD